MQSQSFSTASCYLHALQDNLQQRSSLLEEDMTLQNLLEDICLRVILSYALL
ncbi:hypothetical protein C2S52_006033 [Perilla frutescens var. hirtella]|uniref:Uncharacterized protein n=1 Tax=Perilla frutescens var. hirtella TaxID=608512 RepID=A0AAD4JJX8_PERFH|nr:hypothetical protein C2S52_006033 [Perilla frutescens var. hirtella]KAH6834846.1 hypothetical protein C2S53_000931 [Perilla frutescens var. hirtella]